MVQDSSIVSLSFWLIVIVLNADVVLLSGSHLLW